jgi:hypothetical protein
VGPVTPQWMFQDTMIQWVNKPIVSPPQTWLNFMDLQWYLSPKRHLGSIPNAGLAGPMQRSARAAAKSTSWGN